MPTKFRGGIQKVIKRLIAFFLFIVLAFGCALDIGAEENPSSYSIQVGAFFSLKNAEKVKSQFVKKGYQPYIFKGIDANNMDWFTVRLMDFDNLKAAIGEASKLKEKNIPLAITFKDSLKPVKEGGIPEPILSDYKIVAAYEVEEPGEAAKETAEGAKPSQLEQPYSPSLKDKKTAASGAPPAAASGGEKSVAGGGGPVDSDSLAKIREQMKALEEEISILREESDVRKKLEITEDEKAAKEKEILSSTGRDYTLNKKGTLSLDYGFNYSYNSYDMVADANIIEHSANHSLNNSISVSYAVKDNLTLNGSFPFMYKFDKQGSALARDVTDIGDVSFGLSFQPIKTGGDLPSITFNGNFTFPMGRSPYDIDPANDLATGSGFHSVYSGVSLSHAIDPVVVFGGCNYTYNFNITGIDQNRPDGRILESVAPGDRFGFNMGFGYALSYKVNINLSYSYSYGYKTDYFFKNTASSSSISSVSSTLALGVGFRVSTQRSLNMTFGFGLTNDDSDFSISFRIPFDFKLLKESKES